MKDKLFPLSGYAEIGSDNSIFIHILVPRLIDRLLERYAEIYSTSFDYLHNGVLIVTLESIEKRL
ncbi:MAG: hypothetical protein QXH07_02380 [Thermoplasmata archaeon]